MMKELNTEGTCYPDLHYMMDNSAKLDAIKNMVERGKYFIINRPRQYGKTTTLYALNEFFSQKDDYLSIAINFQGADRSFYKSDNAFAQFFFQLLARYFEFTYPNLNSFIEKVEVTNMESLSIFITRLVHKAAKKIILLIDEVDASSNYQPFLTLLGMFRTKYLARRMPQHATFHSVILAGVHDVKSLKFKLRNPEEAKYDSPWNIAAKFEVEMRFNAKEIAPMLIEYSQEQGITMNIPAIAKRLYYFTSGYPFLVSRLCQIIHKDILSKQIEKTWTLENIEDAVQILLFEDNVNFDSLINNLKNHQDLNSLVFEILMEGRKIGFNVYNSAIQKGILYGVFKRNGQIKIHNRIYEQQIYNYLVSNIEIKPYLNTPNDKKQFLLPNNELDLNKILLKFQKFMQEEYSDRDQSFLEREWRLLFLSFISPIINGEGHTFKEVEISQEKRLDIVITYLQHKYIVELKRWYGAKAHKEGIQQLGEYLERQNKQKGYLVIFEHRTKKTWRKTTIKHGGKEIFAVWV